MQYTSVFIYTDRCTCKCNAYTFAYIYCCTCKCNTHTFAYIQLAVRVSAMHTFFIYTDRCTCKSNAHTFAFLLSYAWLTQVIYISSLSCSHALASKKDTSGCGHAPTLTPITQQTMVAVIRRERISRRHLLNFRTEGEVFFRLRECLNH